MPTTKDGTPRYLPFRIKATGDVGVFDSLTGEMAPFGRASDITKRMVRGAAVDLNNGVRKDSVGWLGAGYVYT